MSGVGFPAICQPVYLLVRQIFTLTDRTSCQCWPELACKLRVHNNRVGIAPNFFVWVHSSTFGNTRLMDYRKITCLQQSNNIILFSQMIILCTYHHRVWFGSWDKVSVSTTLGGGIQCLIVLITSQFCNGMWKSKRRLFWLMLAGRRRRSHLAHNVNRTSCDRRRDYKLAVMFATAETRFIILIWEVT